MKWNKIEMQKPLWLSDHVRAEVIGFGQSLVISIKEEKEDIQLSGPFGRTVGSGKISLSPFSLKLE